MSNKPRSGLKPKPKKSNALLWLVEPLEELATYHRKKMFGCEAIYLKGRLVLVLADSEKPWDGILIPTDREHHAALQKRYPELSSHPVLGKWLYLSQSDASFEGVATSIVDRIGRGEALIGVEPKPGKKR